MSRLPERIAWIDIETTGSNEYRDALLEVACIVTDNSLKELGRCGLVIRHDAAQLERMRAEADAVVRDMHDATGLWTLAASIDGTTRIQPHADQELAAFLDLHRQDRAKVALGGSGAGHFDGRWLRVHMPAAAHRLTYWAYDVGVMRRWFERLGMSPIAINADKTHRAMDDIELHVTEARFFDWAVRLVDSEMLAYDRYITSLEDPAPVDLGGEAGGA